MGATCKACASDGSTVESNTQSRQNVVVRDDKLDENTTEPELNEEKENINNEQIDLNSNINEDEKQGLSELNTYVNQNDDPQIAKTDLPQTSTFVPEPKEEIDDTNPDEDELIVPLKSHLEAQDMSEKSLNQELGAMTQYMSHLESTMNLDTSETCKNFLSGYVLKFEEVNNNSDLSSHDKKNQRGTLRGEAISQWREQNKEMDENILEKQVQFISKGLEDDFYDNTISLGVRPDITQNDDDEKLEVEKPEPTPQEASINIVTDDDFESDNPNKDDTTNNNDNNEEETNNNDDNKENSDPQEPQNNEEYKENNENTENQEPQKPTQENKEEETQPPDEPIQEPETEEPNNEDNKDNSEPQPENPPEEYENNEEPPPTDYKPDEEPPNEENNYETGTVEPPKDENVEPPKDENVEPQPVPVDDEN